MGISKSFSTTFYEPFLLLLLYSHQFSSQEEEEKSFSNLKSYQLKYMIVVDGLFTNAYPFVLVLWYRALGLSFRGKAISV